jgi:hypothetical protein
MRWAEGLAHGRQSESSLLEQPAVMEHLTLMGRQGLAATIEATSDQLGGVTRLARELPELRIVVDHFGWPTDLSDAGRRTHLDRLGELAASHNVATRLDAIGTIFGAWTTEQVRPWLVAIVALFGPDRACLVPIYRSSGCAPASNPCTAPTTRSLRATQRVTAICCCGSRRSSGTGPGDRTAQSGGGFEPALWARRPVGPRRGRDPGRGSAPHACVSRSPAVVTAG